MGHLQFQRVNGLVTVEENIQIDQARTFGNEFLAAHVGFDSAQRVQQIQRRDFVRRLHDAIQEPRLLAQIHGFRFVQRGNTRHAYLRLSQRGNCRAQIFFAVS